MTDSQVLRLLKQVKTAIPSWYEIPLNNSILEITLEGIGVGHVENGGYIFDGYFDFKDEGWAEKLIATLRANTSRFPQQLPG